MAFTKHLLPAWKRILYGDTANAAILSAIDTQLKDAETDALEGRIVMLLTTSTGQWLDQYGDIFGVTRRDDEEDDDYRERIISYVNLERGTIPAIQAALIDYLQDPMLGVDIYEPYNNIFTLNKSKLNGIDGLLGEYYTFAVINVILDKPQTDIDGIERVLEAFKPAGVTHRVTYSPNKYVGDVVELPLSTSEVFNTNHCLEIMNGMNDRVRGHINLSNRHEGETGDPFILNKSKLNSRDRLTGAYSVTNRNLHLATFSNDIVLFDTNTTLPEVLSKTEDVLSVDFYGRTGDIDGLYAAHTVEERKTNYFYITLDLETYCYINYENYLKEMSSNGVYTRELYLELMENPYIQYKLSTTNPTTKPFEYRIELFDLTKGRWTRIKVGSTDIEADMAIVELDSLENYMSSKGLIFTRIVLEPIHRFDGGWGVQPEAHSANLDGGDFSTKIYDGGLRLPKSALDGGNFLSDNDLTVSGGSFTMKDKEYTLRIDGISELSGTKPEIDDSSKKTLDGNFGAPKVLEANGTSPILDGTGDSPIIDGDYHEVVKTVDGNYKALQEGISVKGFYTENPSNRVYDLLLHFFEFGFWKDFAVRPQITVYEPEVTNENVVS